MNEGRDRSGEPTPDGDAGDSGLDSLFGEDQFRDYEDAVLGLNPFVAPPAEQPAAPAPAAPPVATPPVLASPAVAAAASTPAADPWASLLATPPAFAQPTSAQAPLSSPVTSSPALASPVAPAEAPTVRFAPEVGLVAGPAPLPVPVHPEATPAGLPDQPRRRFSFALFWAVLPRPQRILLSVAGVVLLALLLGVIFLLSRGLAASAPPTTGGQPAPEPGGAGAPQPGDTAAWDALRGGECLDPFSGPWEQNFAVVDCGAEHPAQLVHRGLVGEQVVDYPDAAGWQALMPTLCDPAGLLNFDAAGAYKDVQLEFSYPGSLEEWEAGGRDYFCFASRSSGEDLTGSIARPAP